MVAPKHPLPFLSSIEAESPTGVWGWAKRVVENLAKWRWFELLDVPISDKPYYIMRVTADGMGVEYAREELGLSGAVLTGKINQIIRVNATEDGYIIGKEVLHTLIGLVLTGKAKQVIRVNDTEDGYTVSPEVMSSLNGVSLTGKAGYFVKVKADETGFEIVP